MYGIENYRMQTWNIVRVSGRTSQRFALRHVLYPASTSRRRPDEMQHHLVVNMIHRLHRLWFMRVKNLLCNQWWKPGDIDATAQTDVWTFRRIMHCRPSCVYFKGGNSGLLRPCGHHRFCPFCWGRVASFMYRRFKGRILRAKTQHGNLVLNCRVVSQFVPVVGFDPTTGMQPDAFLLNGRALKDIFDQHRAAYKQTTKELQRKTLGSAWRVVVIPQTDGWAVETRQIALTKASRRLPPFIKNLPGEKVFDESTKVSDDEKVYDLLGRFLQYPPELLTAYAELASVYLHAGYRMRLTSGTGLFRTCSSGLIRAFKDETRNERHKEEAEKV